MITSWLDEIRDWLFENNWRRLLGFGIIATTVNSVLWGFVEPTGLNFIVNRYPLYHYGIVLIIAIIIFLCLLPKKLIKELTLENAHEIFKGENWKTTQGNPSVTKITDNIYGSTLKFTGNFSDASRLEILGVLRKANFVKIIFATEQQFQLYVYVSVHTLNKKEQRQIWLALHDNIIIPRKYSDIEWDIPVKCKIKSNQWFEANLNLRWIVRRGLGEESFIYNELLAFQIRGNGVLYSIKLF